jgi:hypothetical protein
MHLQKVGVLSFTVARDLAEEEDSYLRHYIQDHYFQRKSDINMTLFRALPEPPRKVHSSQIHQIHNAK